MMGVGGGSRAGWVWEGPLLPLTSGHPQALTGCGCLGGTHVLLTRSPVYFSGCVLMPCPDGNWGGRSPHLHQAEGLHPSLPHCHMWDSATIWGHCVSQGWRISVGFGGFLV